MCPASLEASAATEPYCEMTCPSESGVSLVAGDGSGTTIGEYGIELSGGQRRAAGIPGTLFSDSATIFGKEPVTWSRRRTVTVAANDRSGPRARRFRSGPASLGPRADRTTQGTGDGVEGEHEYPEDKHTERRDETCE